MIDALYPLLRNLLFLLPPEPAHRVSLQALTLTRGWPFGVSTTLARQPHTVMGLTFPNRLGLAAGLDKNADYLPGLGALGFGFIEVGTVTPRPQPGNPKPRLFRLPRAEAIINRMGFNNQGVDYLLEQVARHPIPGLLGINVGKNFDTPLERAADDYCLGLRKAYPWADYLVVNISSPNTPGLRTLQQGGELARLLEQLKNTQQACAQEHQKTVPLVVKIAPDFTPQDLAETVSTLQAHGIDGVIATNTTVAREKVAHLPHGKEIGGLSGAPLRDAATATVRAIREQAGADFPIIAAGGILSGQDAVEKIQAGADLVQIYTGFIYRGPGLVREILCALPANFKITQII